MAKQITFGVIGWGRIGKRHVELINNNPHCKVVVIIDTDNAKKVQAENLGIPFLTDFEKIADLKEQVDVFCICTPNGFHASLAINALKLGSHVVIEKPMALNKNSAEEIIHTALNAGKQVFCVMQNRYSPPSKWAKEVIESGVLGKVFEIQVNCFWNRDERYYSPGTWHGSLDLDGGTLFTQFSHFVDTLYWLFGDIEPTFASFDSHNHINLTEFEDSGRVLFTTSKGAKGIMHFSTSVYEQNLESSLTVIAEQGSFKIGGQYMDKVEFCKIKDYEMPVLPPANPPNDYGAYKGSAANHAFVFENVVETLNNGKTIATNALEGMKVVEIIEKMYKWRN